MIDENFDPNNRSLTIMEKTASGITGVDSELLRESPPRDRTAVVTIALIMLLVCIWQFIAFAFTAHTFLAAPGEIRPELLAIAALFAVLIMLMDGFMVIRVSWWVAGLEQLKRGGLELPGYKAAKIKNGVLNAVRIALALVPAELIALAVALAIFAVELKQVLDTDAVQANITLSRKLTEQDDADTDRLRGQLTALHTANAKANANAEALRGDALRVAAADPELAAVTARIPALEAAKLEAERRLAEVPREAVTRRTTALRLLAARRTDLEKAQKEQEALRKRADGARQSHGTTVATRLTEATAAAKAAQDEGTKLEAALAQRVAGRAERIRVAVERDVAYVAPDHGILARLRALAKLGESGWNFTLLLLVHAFFLTIELAAVLAKLLGSVPSSYAVRLAAEEYATEAETVDKVYERLRALGGASPPAVAGHPSDEPQPPAPAAANDDATPEDEASDTEDRLRDGARAARAQAAARAKAKEKAADKARDKQVEAAGEPDVTPALDDLTAGPVRRGPGRPAGAKNKPKPANDDQPLSEDEQDIA